MIMIIAIIHIFLSYALFHKQLKINFRKSSALLKKSTPPPLKIKKVQVPIFLPTLKIF